MDERVKRIFDERELNKKLEVAKYLIDKKLYDVEYISGLEDKYKSINSGEYIKKIHDMKLICIREEDNKIVTVIKHSSTEESKKYKVFIPLEFSSDTYTKLVDGDDKLQNNELSGVLRFFALGFYFFAAIFTLIGLFLAADEGGYYFVPVIGSVMFIVFLGLVLHALSYILSNMISINKKLK